MTHEQVQLSHNLQTSIQAMRTLVAKSMEVLPAFRGRTAIEKAMDDVRDAFGELDGPNAVAGDVIKQLEVARARFDHSLSLAPEFKILGILEKSASDISGVLTGVAADAGTDDGEIEHQVVETSVTGRKESEDDDTRQTSEPADKVTSTAVTHIKSAGETAATIQPGRPVQIIAFASEDGGGGNVEEGASVTAYAIDPPSPLPTDESTSADASRDDAQTDYSPAPEETERERYVSVPGFRYS